MTNIKFKLKNKETKISYLSAEPATSELNCPITPQRLSLERSYFSPYTTQEVLMAIITTFLKKPAKLLSITTIVITVTTKNLEEIVNVWIVPDKRKLIVTKTMALKKKSERAKTRL